MKMNHLDETLPPLASLPLKHQSLIKKVARRLVLLDDANERGAHLFHFLGLVRDQYLTDPDLLPQHNYCDPSSLRNEANLRAWYLASMAMREAGDLNEKLARAGEA
jgi:hypothetical protein